MEYSEVNCARVRNAWCEEYTKARDVLKVIADHMTTKELLDNRQKDSAASGRDSLINMARAALEN